ncbi:hypothetical protein [Aeromonas hydrophila]|nr:hypothetical protein [Aeromonas hydrophila]
MGILDWIKVGEVAAESDDNLHLYFYDTGVSGIQIISATLMDEWREVANC